MSCSKKSLKNNYMWFRFYSFLLYILCPVILIYFFIRGHKDPAYKRNFKERLFPPKIAERNKKGLVIHCASVGEVLAAAPLIKQILQNNVAMPVILTCNTPTGRAQLERLFSAEAEICYLPLDFNYSAKRFIKNFNPTALIILETEIWPNLVQNASKQNIPVVLLNARMSEKSLRGYQRFHKFSRNLMACFTHIAAHAQQDAERFQQLGVSSDKLSVTGSIKFDIGLSQQKSLIVDELKRLWVGDRPCWIAGSTHPGEHKLILEAHCNLLESHPSLLLIIAPRHAEQFKPVAKQISDAGLNYCSKAQLDNQISAQNQVLLLDTLGELSLFYGVADIAFIGGSLIERGGHNPLEAAVYSKPILCGPSVYNFNDIYQQLSLGKGCFQVNDSQQLSNKVNLLLENRMLSQSTGMAANTVLNSHQGAIDKSLTIITDVTKVKFN